MENIAEKLGDINQTLEKQYEVVKQMLEIMPRPDSKFITTLQTVVLIIGALGFINLVEVIIKWIGG